MTEAQSFTFVPLKTAQAIVSLSRQEADEVKSS